MITPIYAAILSFVLLYLIIKVIRLRQSLRVPLGHGDNHELTAAIRAHGNFIETAPWGLALMLMVELQEAEPLAIHALGFLLTAGRIIHLMALAKTSIPLRIIGMVATIAVIAIAATYNFILALF